MSHLLDPSFAVDLPAGQSSQVSDELALAVVLYRPMPQLVQDSTPELDEYLPAPHDMQSIKPVRKL